MGESGSDWDGDRQEDNFICRAAKKFLAYCLAIVRQWSGPGERVPSGTGKKPGAGMANMIAERIWANWKWIARRSLPGTSRTARSTSRSKTRSIACPLGES